MLEQSSQPRKSPLSQRIALTKVFMCLFFAVMTISVASIFIVSRFFSDRVAKDISGLSLLKDSTYAFWGSQPNPDSNSFQKTYQLYNFVGNVSKPNVTASDFQLSENKHVFDLEYRYNNLSFAQGDSGQVSLLNYWQLSNGRQTNDNETVTNLNLALNKAYWEQVHSPIQRIFPISFNRFFENLKEVFLPWFYSETMFRYYFSKRTVVENTVFNPLGFQQELKAQLYEDQRYGWGDSSTLNHWVKLSLSGKFEGQTYEEIRMQFGLDATQIEKLIGSGSIMSKLTKALNGTMKKKLFSNIIKYTCKNSTCSDAELLAAQWTSSFLTTSQFFNGVNLNTGLADYNTSFPATPEYGVFCMENGMPEMGVSTAVPLFLTNNMTSFVTSNFILNYKDNPSIVEKELNILGYGDSFTQYFSQYFVQEVIRPNLTDSQYGWASLVYETFNFQYSQYSQFLIEKLLSSALFNKYSKSISCKDYFANQFASFGKACSNEKYAIGSNVGSYAPYVNAYFYQGRKELLNFLNMTNEQAYNFFRNPKTSVFAKQINLLLSDFQKHYSCEGQLCNAEELAARQWGQNSILSNLHPDYFTMKSVSILDWDTQKTVFRGMSPEYAVFRQDSQLTYQRIVELVGGYGPNSIRGLSGLVNLLNAGKEKDVDQFIDYLNELLRTQTFGGLLVNMPEVQYASGYTDSVLKRHKETPSILGGTPWKQDKVRAVKLDNKQVMSTLVSTELSQLNTGIYNTDLLRSWKSIYGHSKSGLKYVVDWNQGDGVVSYWKDTNRSISGTDMLGFKNNIKVGQSLQIYIEWLGLSYTLVYSETLDSAYTIYRYKFKEAGTVYFLGQDTLDNLQVTLADESFVDVEASTGQTTELRIVVEYGYRTSEFMPDNFANCEVLPSSREITTFKRSSLAKYDSINANSRSIRIAIPIYISLGAFSVLMIAILAVVLMRLRKRRITLEQDDQVNEGFNPIRTKTEGKESLLTGGGSYIS